MTHWHGTTVAPGPVDPAGCCADAPPWPGRCENSWPCHNPEPHDAPRGCVHHSEAGSEVPDRHDDGGHG